MFHEPDAYGLPCDLYPENADELDRELARFPAASKVKDQALKYLLSHRDKRSKANGALRHTVDFMLRIGARGAPCAEGMRVTREKWDEVAGKSPKQLSIDVLLHALERVGMAFEDHGGDTLVSNRRFPDMFGAYCALCRACEDNKKLGFLFARCDFRALLPGFKWSVSDILRPLSAADRDRLAELDRYMMGLKYGRTIEFEGRYLYTLKGKGIFRVQTGGDEYTFYFRWPLDESRSADMFGKLRALSPALEQFVFSGLCRCNPDCVPGYGVPTADHCLGRVRIVCDGQEGHTCMDGGLTIWGHEREDFESIKAIAGAMREMFA